MKNGANILIESYAIYSCDHDRRAAIDPSVAIALVPGISQAAIAVDKSRDTSRQKPRQTMSIFAIGLLAPAYQSIAVNGN